MSRNPFDKLVSSDAVVRSISALIVAVTTTLLASDD